MTVLIPLIQDMDHGTERRHTVPGYEIVWFPTSVMVVGIIWAVPGICIHGQNCAEGTDPDPLILYASHFIVKQSLRHASRLSEYVVGSDSSLTGNTACTSRIDVICESSDRTPYPIGWQCWIPIWVPELAIMM